MNPIPDDVQKFLEEITGEINAAFNNGDEKAHDQLCQELKSFYQDHKQMGTLHYAVVETLADFTENKQEAVRLYQEALEMSQPDDPRYMILISMAEAMTRLGHKEKAKITALNGLREALNNEDYFYISEAESLLKELNEQ